MATRDDDKDLNARDDGGDDEKPAASPEPTDDPLPSREEDDDDDDDARPPAKTSPASRKAGGTPPKALADASKAAPAGSIVKKGGPSSRGTPSSKGAKGAPITPPKRKGSLGTSVILFVIVVGGLATGFAILGRETGGGAPKWKDGQEVDVEVTLLKSDRRDLACAAAQEVQGRHCAFESKEKRWSKPDKPDAKNTLLQPYTTTNQIQFVAAGLWSEPALENDAQLPTSRFSAKCKFKVEGRMKKLAVRWHTEGGWSDGTDDWYSGLLSGCTVIPATRMDGG